MTYVLSVSKSVVKTIAGIAKADRTIAQAIKTSIDSLSVDAKPPGSEPLTANKPLRKLKGNAYRDYRIVYWIEEPKPSKVRAVGEPSAIVHVVLVAHRRD